MAFQSGFITTIATKLSAWDTTLTVATAPTITSGRVFIKSWTTKERISFTWVSTLTLTGLTRQLSTTAVPATSGWSGYDFLAWTSIKIVAMHDQMADIQWNNTFSGTNTFTGTMNFTNVWDLNVNGKSNPAPVVANVTVRDALYTSPVTGDEVYVESLNAKQIYNTGTASWETQWAWTTVVDASESVKWIWQVSTTALFNAWTDLGSTWAYNIPKNSDIQAWFTSLSSWFWSWIDWNVTITTTITMTRDMYYNNLTITSPWILIPNWYRIYVKWTLAGNWKIQRNGNNWWNWSWSTKWAWATALNQWTLNAEIAWSDGGDWWETTWSNWVAGLSNNPSYSTTNWVAWWTGWAWSVWWAGTLWAWWTSTRWVLYNIWTPWAYFSLIWPASFTFNNTQYKWISWSGGWSGWWWASSWAFGAWGWGWWWGWNGWFIRCAINTINWTWTFESIWWVGWNWGNWGNGWWGWWWWGWWSGWVVRLIYKTLTSLWSSTLSGWTGWTKGLKWWAWTDWSNWTAGNSWVLIQIAA